MNTVMLQTFVTAASTGSISEAAKKLSYSESTVAYHIREVEKVCGTRLFDKEMRGLILTRRGQAAVDIARQLLHFSAQLTSLPARPLRTDRMKPAVLGGGATPPSNTARFSSATGTQVRRQN